MGAIDVEIRDREWWSATPLTRDHRREWSHLAILGNRECIILQKRLPVLTVDVAFCQSLYNRCIHK